MKGDNPRKKGITSDQRQRILDLYASGLNTREVAAVVNCGKSTAAAYLNRCGISRKRTIRECVIQSKVKHCRSLDDQWLSLFDGLMISDGSLTKPTSKFARTTNYTQSCVHQDWLTRILHTFMRYGMQGVVLPETRTNRRQANKNQSYVLRTKYYRQLFDQYERWYQDGEKIVPRDIKLTPTMVRTWIMGDGTLNRGCHLRLCCDSFRSDDVEFMIEQFGAIGYTFKKLNMGKSKRGIDKWRLTISKAGGLVDLYRWLGPSELSCFEYKWYKESKCHM